MRPTASAPRARLICFLICLSLLSQTLLPASAGASGRHAGKSRPPAGRASAAQETEATNLPDLDEARTRLAYEPKAVLPVPSTRRRCPRGNPRCNDGVTGQPSPTPTASPAPTPSPTPAQSPTPSPSPAQTPSPSPSPTASPTPAGQPAPPSPAPFTSWPLLALASPGVRGDQHWLNLGLLDYYTGAGYSVSDSRVRLLPPTGYAAAPSAEPAVPYQSQGRLNFALASNGGVASASSTHAAYSLSAVNDGDRKGPGYGGVWGDATSNVYPDWVQFDFTGTKVIDEVDLFSVQNNGFTNSVEPTQTMTGSQYVVTSFEVQYWTGTTWAAVPGGSVTGNNLIWRRVTFAEVTTTKVRVVINGTADNYSQVPEVEVWGREAPHVNYALALNGATAAASSQVGTGYPAAAAINGDRKGAGYGAGGAWVDGTSDAYPDWLEVSFGGERRIDEVDVIGLQEAYANPSEPTQAMTGRFALTDFQVQYWTGAAWATISEGSVTGNDKVWRRFTFPEVLTTKVRVWVTRVAGDNHSVITELEAWGPQSLPPGTGLTGEYYNGLNFDTYVLTRSDAAVNFDWGSGSPSQSMGADGFSVRWTGTVIPRYTESYTFYATTDDGVRLWLDGQLVIDRWIDQSPSEAASAPVALEAGRHYAVRMEYYEHGGSALAWLKWSSASQAKEIIPQSHLYGCWKGADQFAKDFFLGALWRQPSAAELQDWAGRLNQAQGAYHLVAEAQGLGVQLFTSAEYAARNRTDGQYVSDLYWAYLQRAPDPTGLTGWTNHIAQCGSDQSCRAQRRVEVRAAFEQSLEFGEKVGNLCGTAAAASDNGGVGYNFTTARLDPVNRTGGGGVDPYSRNYNFSIPLVSLAGRAGLDLGLVLSYNSLVWTKDATGVTFDADEGFPSPGFRLGFPVIQPKFVNPLMQQAGQSTRYSYLLLTPSGARVELRQVGTSNTYESADSSYLQLTEADMTLRSTDGTRLSFALLNGSYRCYEVKDRNGNYLSVAYYGDGRIDKVIDTLGRAVTFNYDNFQNLISITQPWTREGEPGVTPTPTPDAPHQWATFGYENRTLQPQFSNLAVIGEQPGAVIPVINQVGLADGSFYRFKYNQWGQVWKVTHYAADSAGANNESHPLTSQWVDLPGAGASQGSAGGVTASPQTDCPRFKEERVWVEHGVMGENAEVTTKYDDWAPGMSSCEVTLPDNTTKQVSSYYTSAEGWKKGLVASEVTISEATTVRTATPVWEHDGASNAAYPTNVRVTQTSVSDPQGNARTTRVTYTTPADYQVNNGYTGTLNLRLPRKVEECADSNCTPVLRTTVTDYSIPNLDQYAARRILGLSRFQYLYEGAEASGNLRSKVEYLYDEANSLQDTFLALVPSPASQQDGTNYGQSMPWRGNANRVRRYAVDQTTGTVGDYVESRAGFNVTGTTAYAKDALGHKSSISYTDSFFQNVNRTHTDPQYRLQTYAYPTTVTDPDNFTASTSFNYDMGVMREAQTPLPNVTTNQPGPLSRLYYDAAGRVIRSLNVETGAYTYTAYPAKMDLVESYALVEAGKESRTVQVLDGAGRVRAASRYLPPLADTGTGTYPSAYNYAGQKFDYDEMGRLAQQSNPAEVNASWAFAGDDTAWVYTSQTFDWKGRPLVTTHEADGSKFEYQYDGCGCAGGLTVSTRDEVGRRRRVTSDATGRIETTQVFTQQATNVVFTISPIDSPYSTVTNTFDGLGRIREVKERDEARGVEQLTATEYDGHGRLWRRHLPQYAANKFTTYAYNDDDTLASVTDPRDAVAAYSYVGNNRHLVTQITHTLTGSPTLTTTFQYDAAGNRTQMDDGPGWVTYQYDVLSRLLKERRHFDALASNTHNPYELNYSYTASGQLKTLSDPFGAQFTYGFDRAGQLKEVKDETASPYASVTTYVSDVQYRAWGEVKSATFGDGSAQTTSYDSRMRPSQYRMAGGASALREDFTYYADGRLHQITDLDDTGTGVASYMWRNMSREYKYDHVGRVSVAGGNVGGNITPSPFYQTYGYDGFGNLTSRSGTYGYRMSQSDGAGYSNNRRDGWTYDAAGHLTVSTGGNDRTWDYDAAGRLVSTTEARGGGVSMTLRQATDGDGQVIYNSSGSTAGTDHAVRSTVLDGEVITRLTSTGEKGYTYVPAGGLVRARQVGSNYYGQPAVEWSHPDAVGVTESGLGGLAAYDPLGNYAPLPPPPPQSQPWPQPSGQYGPIWGGAGSLFSNINNFSTGCLLDGRPADCNRVTHALADGLANVDSNIPWYAPRAGGVTFIPVTQTRTVKEEPGGIIVDGAPPVRGHVEFFTSWVPVPDGVFTPPPDVKQIGEILQEMLSASTCSTFVSDLYRQVDIDNPINEANSKTIWDLFGKVTAPGQGGIIRRYPLIIGGKAAAGTVSGSLETNNATVILAGIALHGGISVASSEEISRLISIHDAITTLHELFHHAGTNYGFSDKQLAKAAAKLPGASSGLPNEDENDSYEWSKYWDKELQNHCKRPAR